MKLLLLRCPVCGQPLTPADDDVVFACTNCHTPVYIGPAGIRRFEVRFAVPEGVKSSGDLWLPFWVFEGSVQIKRRETQGRSRSEGAVQALWSAPRRLFVPAWPLPFEKAQALGSRLIQRQAPVQFVEPASEARLTAATITAEDAQKLLEFIVLAIEARRDDYLRTIDFEMELDGGQLWAMPGEVAR
ncbi:MAG: hypothetical protein ACWGPS_06210 [Candidatus Promineifilaceae bacterium]